LVPGYVQGKWGSGGTDRAIWVKGRFSKNCYLGSGGPNLGSARNQSKPENDWNYLTKNMLGGGRSN